MKAILQYVQKVIASGKDGTICIMIDTGEVASLTVKERSIIAATLENSTGKEALEAIKLAVITHMEFWNGITRKNDIHKMIITHAETNALAPIPEDELCPEGVPIPVDTRDQEEQEFQAELEPETQPVPETRENPSPEPEHASEPFQNTSDEPKLTEQHIRSLSEIMTEFIGPAAGYVVEDVIEKSDDLDDIIRLLSDELFDDKDRVKFTNKAYFLLSQL